MKVLFNILEGFFNGCGVFSLGFIIMSILYFIERVEKKMNLNNIHGYLIIIAIIIGSSLLIDLDKIKLPDETIAKISSVIFIIIAVIYLVCVFAAISDRDDK